MKKRVLSILLALILVIGIIPMSAISASADAVEGGSGQGQEMPAPQNVQATLIGFVVGDSGKALVVEIEWDALPADIDGSCKFVEMYPSLKEDANLSLPMSFEAWLGQATLIPVEELQEGGIGYVTKDGRSKLRSVVHILQPGDLKVDENGMACGVKENDVVDIDIYTAGWDPATQTDLESAHKHVEIVYTEENVKNKKTFTEAGEAECTHENTESTAEVLNVKGNVTIGGESTGVALIKDTDKCTDCQNKKTTKVYRLRFKNRLQMYKYLSGKYAQLRSGKKVHFKGKFEKIEKVFWNKKYIKVSKTYNKKKGSVILEFTDEFLATVEDGIHELMVCNGDEFTAMSVTVQDHEMVEIGAFDMDDHAEISADQYEALMQECEDDGIEVIDCDLDEFYAGGFMVNADDSEVTMNLSRDTFICSGDPIELPAVTLTSEMGVEYAQDEDYSLTYYQLVEGIDGEEIEVEIDPEQIKDIGVYNVVATPTRNGVLFGEASAHFVIIDEADCPHVWETLYDESGHYRHCSICGVSTRIQAHENWTIYSEISHVTIPEEADFEESELLCVTVYAECDDCGYRYPGTLYNVVYSYDESCYPLAALRNAELSEEGNAIYLDGDPEADTYIFVDGVMLPDDCIDTVYGAISDEYLATIEDGDHEVMILNGDNFTVMTVTVTDHKLTEIKNKRFSDYEEMTFTDYYDTIVEYYIAGSDVIYCDLDELVPIIGDVDGDGEINVIDATWIQRYNADIDLPFVLNPAAADVDGDEEIGIEDATWIQRYDADMNCPRSIGQPVSWDF